MIDDEERWFGDLEKSSNYTKLKARPVAYFCAEYALSDDLPTFAGGLGVLAGDYVREAADREIPLVAVGLYYEQGFTRQELSREGKIIEAHESKVAEEAGLTRVVTSKGDPLTVSVPIQDHNVLVRAWAWTKGMVTVYFLDTRVPQNSEADQKITDQLYVTDKELRLKQELILGIGGLRVLEALDHHPSVYHLNEGHSAFLVYELIHHEMREHGLTFEAAKMRAKERVLFTNHTLVPAGNDVFSNDLVALLLSDYAAQIQVPVKTLVDLGLVQQSSTFSMTILAMRAAGKINAVSKLHSEKAKEIWSDHPMFPITNGIHIPSWDRVGSGDIWEMHRNNKRALLTRIVEEAGIMWDERTILLGWARRIVGYKRPLALVERMKRFSELAHDAKRPIQIVFAGQSHPSDEDGTELLSELQYRLSSDLKGVAVYLPNYNLELAQMMVSGCDVWVNTPVVGFEACGTSGMKAALNGVLPLTTRDGWVHEIELLGVGWGVDDTNVTDDILAKLEKEILPLYYESNDQGQPVDWITMMKNARELICNEFSMTRALHQYLEMGMGVKV